MLKLSKPSGRPWLAKDVSTGRRGRFCIQAAFLAACLGLMAATASAATTILNFDFDQNNTDNVKESVNNLTGTWVGAAPASISDSPSGGANDRAIEFAAGQRIQVEDLQTKMQLDPANPSFTLQAWLKFSGNPAARQVFFYSNGPGGAISFSVNTDRTVFVTTLGIVDASSQAAIPDDGAWHHVAVVHESGKELRYYVDGVLRHTRAETRGVIFTRTQTSFWIGAEPAGGLQYVGALDRLKITSGMLAAEQLDFKAKIEAPPTVFWEAFNDHRPTDGVTSPNASIFDMRAQDNGGVLRNIANGSDLPVSVLVRVEGDGVPDDFGANTQPDAGSPAEKLFTGKVDVGNSGIPGVRNSVSTKLILVFSGLNPSRRYNFAGTASRGNNYNDRWSFFTLSSAIEFVAAHVDGSQNLNIFTKTTFPAGALEANQVALNSGDNKAGSLVAWNNINPGADGIIEIAAAQYVGPAPFGDPAAGPYGYAFSAIYLAEVGSSAAGDSDNDGMPDSFETANGFDPKDPSDAAKDFDKDGATNLDEYKAGTNPVDLTKPTIVSASTSGDFKTITITFSEELDPATATAAANYSVSPALAVTGVTYNRKVTTLTTAAQTPGGTAYTVTVKGVKDTSKNEVDADTKATIYSYLQGRAGMLRFAWWAVDTKLFPEDEAGSLNGASPIETLLDHPRYVSKTPNQVLALFSFSSRDAFPTDAKDNYGATIEGLLTPTESGSYRFFIHSDDSSRLWLSTDDKEANLAQVAEETGCCGNFAEPDVTKTSEPIALVANKSYFIRLAYKEGGGGDYGRVAWRKEGDTTPAASLLPIPGKFLSSVVDLPVPSEATITTRTPGTDAKNVSPATAVTVVQREGKTAWTAANVSLKFDGVTVTPTFTKSGSVSTIVYQPTGLLASESKHTVSLTYPDAGGNPVTLEWSFDITKYTPIKDVVKGYDALLRGAAVQTADKGGFSGATGDFGIDLTSRGAPIQVVDAAFLAAVNAATAADELSVSVWIKKYDIAASSGFWFSSPSQARVYQAHIPWSDNSIYFDTAGCCDGTTQRINANIDTFPGFVGDTTDTSWWRNWRHYVFTKKADHKVIYVDGVVFLDGSSSGLLSTDINQLAIGADNALGSNMHAVIDDFAVFGKELTPANVVSLAAKTKASALPAAAGLLAYWDFNKTATEPPKITSITKVAGGNVTITWTGGGTLEAAASVTGPWQAVTGASSPYTFAPSQAQLFGRIRQ